MRYQAFRQNGMVAALLLGTAMFAAASSNQVVEVNGVENFHQVNEHVFRGAQPTTDGFQNLAKLGVKTVIDLREADGRSALEKKAVEADGMRYINVPLNGMSAPSPANVAKILAIFDDPTAGPVFIHCRRGADRTGTIVACYRIAHDKWDNVKALTEAKADGMAWIEKAMQNYVLHYQPEVASAVVTSNLQ